MRIIVFGKKDLAGNLTPLNFNMPTPSHTWSGARVRMLQRRHEATAFTNHDYLQAVLDFAK